MERLGTRLNAKHKVVLNNTLSDTKSVMISNAMLKYAHNVSLGQGQACMFFSGLIYLPQTSH